MDHHEDNSCSTIKNNRDINMEQEQEKTNSGQNTYQQINELGLEEFQAETLKIVIAEEVGNVEIEEHEETIEEHEETRTKVTVEEVEETKRIKSDQVETESDLQEAELEDGELVEMEEDVRDGDKEEESLSIEVEEIKNSLEEQNKYSTLNMPEKLIHVKAEDKEMEDETEDQPNETKDENEGDRDADDEDGEEESEDDNNEKQEIKTEKDKESKDCNGEMKTFRCSRWLTGNSHGSDSSDESDDEGLLPKKEPSDDELEELATRNQDNTNKVPRGKGELTLEDLPPIEALHITVSDDVELVEIGFVLHNVGVLVVIESKRDSPPLDVDTVLFLEGKKVLGKVFDTIGPVVRPIYTVRFNRESDIHDQGIEPGMPVFYAPKSPDWTHYVFLAHLMKMRGSDASWEHDIEPPQECLDYSDDATEHRVSAKQRGCTADDGEDTPNTNQNKRRKRMNRGGRGQDQSYRMDSDTSMNDRNFFGNSTRGRGRGGARQAEPGTQITSWPPSDIPSQPRNKIWNRCPQGPSPRQRGGNTDSPRHPRMMSPRPPTPQSAGTQEFPQGHPWLAPPRLPAFPMRGYEIPPSNPWSAIPGQQAFGPAYPPTGHFMTRPPFPPAFAMGPSWGAMPNFGLPPPPFATPFPPHGFRPSFPPQQ